MGKLREIKLLNTSGLTLVEILVSIILLSLVLALTMTVVSFGQKQYSSQNSKINIHNDVTLAMKDVTKEIRSAITINVGGNTETLETYKCGNTTMTESHMSISGDILTTESHEYAFSNNQLLKDGLVLVDKIKSVKFTQTDPLITEELLPVLNEESCPLLNVEIIGLESEFSLETEIFIRR